MPKASPCSARLEAHYGDAAVGDETPILIARIDGRLAALMGWECDLSFGTDLGHWLLLHLFGLKTYAVPYLG